MTVKPSGHLLKLFHIVDHVCIRAISALLAFDGTWCVIKVLRLELSHCAELTVSVSILGHTLSAFLAFTLLWLRKFLDERVGVIRVTLWLAISRHILPRESQSSLTVFAFGVVYIKISLVAGAFPLTAHYAH